MNEQELQAKIEEKDAHLQALTEMSVAMNSFRSLSELISYVSRKTKELVEAEKVSIMLVDPHSEHLSIVASDGVAEEVIAGLHLRKGEGIAGKVWETGHLISIPDTSLEAQYHKSSRRDASGPASLLSVPVEDSNEFFGAINVQRPVAEGAFDEEAIRLLTLIALYTAGSIRNVRLVTDLEDRIRNIHAAQEIGNLLVSTFDVDTVLTLIVRGIRDVTGAEACSIMLWDKDEEHLVIRASEGVPERIVESVRIKRGENIAGWVAENAQPLLIRNLDDDPRFRATAKGRYCSNSVLSVPMNAKGKVLGVINVNNLTTSRVFNANDQNLLTLFANQAAIALENARLYRELEKLAITDGLTGLANHRTFQERLLEQMARATRFDQTLSLVMIDIDYFKSINDKYGHQTGDHVLRCVAQTLQRAMRKMDIIARYGGEEFAIIMPQTPQDTGLQTAERLRKEIQQCRYFPSDPERSITVSIGLAEYPSHAADAATLVELSDRALYISKGTGRNRVTVAQSEEEEKEAEGATKTS